jgi:aspartate/methionine/tyrosine aminotransferase
MLNDSTRIVNIQKPIIPLLAEWISESPGTISLAQGIVHYPPPNSSFEFLKNNLKNSVLNKYNIIEGIPELSRQISKKLNRDNSILLKKGVNKTFVSAGANMAFFNIIFSITNPGDEIIILSPFYFNYEMAIQIADCKAVIVTTDNNYQPIPEKIKNAITPKTQAIVTISPNNPTGVIYKKELLTEINNICKEENIFHISDEAYEYFMYDNKEHFSPASLKDSEKHTISIFSLSKTYGMAGWRIGYCVYPEFLDTSVKKVQDTNLICAPVASQYLASDAIKTGMQLISPYIKEIEEVKNIVIQKLNLLGNKISFIKPNGAFFVFIKINTKISCIELTKELISKYKIAVVPGFTFGMNNGCYLRLAFGALNKQTVSEGIDRFVKGINDLV